MPGEGPLVLDAATSEVLDSASIDGTSVSAAGYQTKSYPDGTPAVVRLLADEPAVFCDRVSTSPGDRIEVSLVSPAAGTLHLRRWQRADLPELTFTLGETEPSTGTVPDLDPVSAPLDWPSIQVDLPHGIPTGLWLVELVTAAGTARAPLVIRCDAERTRPRVLAVASAATWACYNEWGGRNRYRNLEQGPGRVDQPPTWRRTLSAALARAVPEVPRTRIKRALGRDSTQQSFVSRRLSLHRPWSRSFLLGHPVEQPVLSHVAPLDAKILAWLDDEGIDYECVTDLDLHDGPDLCRDRDAIVLMGHSEYWSAEMFRAVRTAHLEHGTWLLNLSGNSMYRQIEVTRGWIRMSDVVAALAGADETELLGGRFSAPGYGLATPYAVVDPQHWIFAGTGVSQGDRFGQQSLIANTDPAFTASYDPARPTTPDARLAGAGAAGFEVDRIDWRRRREFRIVARGTSRHGAHMLVRMPEGPRGGVFSVGSITFGGALAVDPVCASVTRAVLARASAAVSRAW